LARVTPSIADFQSSTVPGNNPAVSGTATANELLETGRRAFERNAWSDAYVALSAADSESQLGPGDLDALGRAAWLTGRVDDSIRAHERAYAAYLAAGDKRSAAIVGAWWLAGSYENKAMLSIAEVWKRRATQLLEDEPEGVEHGWIAFVNGETDRALEIAKRYGDRGLEARALHRAGKKLVAEGRVAEGLALIDEVCTSIAANEILPDEASIMYCSTIGVCEDLCDYQRAAEWWEIAHEYFLGFGPNVFPSMCRFHRALFMDIRGSWDEAEQESLAGIAEMEGFDPWIAALSFRQYGNLRRRRGDLAGAEEAYRRSHEGGLDPQPGLALLRLEQDRPDAALQLIQGAFNARDITDLDRARDLLPALVTIAIAAGDQDVAARAVEELGTAADRYGTSAFIALSARARGEYELSIRNSVEAIKTLRRAANFWRDVDAPYEAARTRFLLAEAHLATGDVESATLELETAGRTFQRLGAEPDRQRVTALLDRVNRRSESSISRRTFLFTDIVASTTLIETLGDAAWADLRRWHDMSLRSCFSEHRGEEIDHAGDGFFVTFPDTDSAIECALGIQRKLLEHRRSHGFAPAIRMGLHSDDAPVSDGKYIGRGVHIAARIAALAAGGEILASSSTIEGVQGVTVTTARDVYLKGITEPVSIVSIDWS
jgi:class 3 adenylate cyclase